MNAEVGTFEFPKNEIGEMLAINKNNAKIKEMKIMPPETLQEKFEAKLYQTLTKEF